MANAILFQYGGQAQEQNIQTIDDIIQILEGGADEAPLTKDYSLFFNPSAMGGTINQNEYGIPGNFIVASPIGLKFRNLDEDEVDFIKNNLKSLL